MSNTERYEQLAARHGHYCPMSTLGLRLGFEAVHRLADAEAGAWQFCYRARTCAVDGLALALENSPLAYELRVESLGQHLLLCQSAAGRELSLMLSNEALQLAAQYQTLAADAQPEHLQFLRHIVAERIIIVTELSG